MFRPGKDKGIATPIPLGLAALATSTFLMGIALIFQPPAAWGPYLVESIFFGGIIEVLAGMWSFSYGDPLAATVFSFVGAFYCWWGLVNFPLVGVHAAGMAALGSAGMVFIVVGVVTAYLWVASFNESAAFNLTMLFLWISFVLSGIFAFTALPAIAIVAGVCALISGIIGAYASFGELYNAAALNEVVPLGEPQTVRARSEREEYERIRRLHSGTNGSTMPESSRTYPPVTSQP